jgi:hypothetical protein
MASTFATLIDLIEGAGETAASRFIYSKPMLGTIIRQGMQDGMSGRAILSQYRVAGGKISNQTFWSLNQQVRSNLNRFAAGFTPGQGGDTPIEQISGGKAGSYRVEFRAYYTRTEEDGSIEKGYQQFTLHQRELDLNAAAADATSIWSDNSDTQSFPGTLLGLEITGVYQYTGR